MTTNNLKASVESSIKAITVASKALFVELGKASRELLMYVPDSNDIGMVNRLLNVLNRHDRDNVVIFFQEFLPWKYDEKAGLFLGKLSGDRRLNEMAVIRDAFLKRIIDDGEGKNHEATVWDWTKENVQATERKVDFNNNLVSLIQRATAEKNKDGTENKYRITNTDIIVDVMNAGITLDEMFSVVTKALDEKKKAEAKSNLALANQNKPKRERKAKVAKVA